jgi:hypothetical protein
MSTLRTKDLFVPEEILPVIAIDLEYKKAVLRRTFPVDKTVFICSKWN